MRSKGGEPQWNDSMEKLAGVFKLCDECGVHTRPKLLGGSSSGEGGGEGGAGGAAMGKQSGAAATSAVWVVPVVSWWGGLRTETRPTLNLLLLSRASI